MQAWNLLRPTQAGGLSGLELYMSSAWLALQVLLRFVLLQVLLQTAAGRHFKSWIAAVLAKRSCLSAVQQVEPPMLFHEAELVRRHRFINPIVDSLV